MNWVKPHSETLRLGYEVTGYLYQRTKPSETLSVAKTAMKEPKHAYWRNFGRLGVASIATRLLQYGSGLLILSMVSLSAYAAQGGANWNSRGGDEFNRSFASTESKISAQAVKDRGLKVKWAYDTRLDMGNGVFATGSVTTPPAVVGDTIYFPSYAPNPFNPALKVGQLHAVNAATGVVKWKKPFTQISAEVSALLGKQVIFEYSRMTPAVSGNLLYLGGSAGFKMTGKMGAVFLGLIGAAPDPLPSFVPYPIDPSAPFGGADEVFRCFRDCSGSHHR
jgi:outer membrane protein assembly factor BamB